MVAIIDSGIHRHYPGLEGSVIEELDIHESDVSHSENLKKKTLSYHGTNIALLIHSISPSVKMLSIRLIARDKLRVNSLVKALNYCSTRSDIKIINISLGILTKFPPTDLLRSCLLCYNAQKVIVAAAHPNSQLKCYPAAYRFVFGVGTGMIKNLKDFSYLKQGYINILAKGVHQKVIGENGFPILSSGTSYAAAAFTGCLAELCRSSSIKSHKKLLQVIKSKSIIANSIHYPIVKVDFVFPKIIVNLNRNWMVFPIDDPHSIKVAEEYNETKLIMKYPFDPLGELNLTKSRIKIISGILSPKLFNQIDTLVLGNFFRNKYLINIYFGYALIDFFIKNNADIIVWDKWIFEQITERVLINDGKYSGNLNMI